MLKGAGALSGAQSCDITAGNLHLYAEIRGEAQFEGQVPQVMCPSRPAVASHSKLEVLKEMVETQKMVELIAKVSAYNMEANVGALLS